MARDLRPLAEHRFDLLVVGAGFYGATAAWDAAQRGLSVALIDRDDFGAATSFNSLKTLHGGLRSLQALNLKQMRLFIRERRALARVVPHLVERLPFCVPTYGDPRRSALLMRVALGINDVVASDKHAGLADPAHHLPPGRVVSRDEALEMNPLVDPDGITGAAVWHDYQMRNAERVTYAFVASTAATGAVVANYVGATGTIVEDGTIVGVTAEDRLTGAPFAIRARVVLNAAGPWAGEFLRRLPGGGPPSPAPKLSRAMNLVTRKVTRTHACGGLVDGRFLFYVPWRDVSILGTSHDVHAGDADGLRVTEADLEAFLADGRAAFPRAGLRREDVRLVHRGLLPMIDGHGHKVALLRESTVIDHAAQGAPGLISIFGVRYTTARHTGREAADAVFRRLGVHTPPPSRSAETPVGGGDIPPLGAFLAQVRAHEVPQTTPDVRARLALTYGSAWTRVARRMAAEPALAAPLGALCAVTRAEIADAVEHEQAVTLSDALLRRTEAGTAGHPGPQVATNAAHVMAPLLGWDARRTTREIAEFDAFYAISR
jgi:glycerol-3-phosphate dehydrogenase